MVPFALHHTAQIAHHIAVQSLAALNRDNSGLSLFAVRLAVIVFVDSAVCALLLAAIGDGIDERHCPPLELKFVALGQIFGTGKIFGRAVNLELDTRKRILEASFDQADGQMCDVDSDPSAARRSGAARVQPQKSREECDPPGEAGYRFDAESRASKPNHRPLR